MDDNNTLSRLRNIEQQVQRLHERLRLGYSGIPEVMGIKTLLNDAIECEMRRAALATVEGKDG